MGEIVFEALRALNLIKNETELAYNEIDIDGNEVIIVGNAMGLIHLAEVLVQIAIKNIDETHIHLYEPNFFNKANGELIIAKCVKK
jgi:hypothetical protein